jgi:hypothetical protein
MNEGVSENLDLQSVRDHPKNRAAADKGQISEVAEGWIQAPGYAPQWWHLLVPGTGRPSIQFGYVSAVTPIFRPLGRVRLPKG